ncbi:MAG: SBBP repeat-containing protein, partial [Anaerolineae bacterium]
TYITGITFSTEFFSPTPPDVDDKNVFVARINADGSLGYLTIFGGISGEEGNAIGVDMFGNAYVAGETFSPNFPTLNAWQPNFAGYEDAYVLKLDPQGQLVWSTFIGGTGAEEIDDIYVDAAGNVYAAGEVYSDDFPLLNPWQWQTYGPGDEDAFISIFNANGQLVYSTYIAAEQRDQIFRITLGPDGYIYATGMTSSPSFPTVHPFQAHYGGGWDDAFVLKFDPWTNRMLYSTFLGGVYYDEGWGIAVDQEGNAYVAGRTNSPNFPLSRPRQSSFGGGDYDAFVAKIGPQGDTLLFSTFIGGPGIDEAWGLAMDDGGHIYITGMTQSPGQFPLRNALQPYYGGG